jgi:DNA-binding NtrC family response regulator
MKGKILVVDDNKSVLTALEMLLQTEFENVLTLKNPDTMISVIGQNAIDLVLLDMNFRAGINSGNEGLYWMRQILELDSNISIVMITAHGDVELAVSAVKKGAFDFILKPWDNNKLISTLHAGLKLRKSKLEAKRLRETTAILKQQLMPPAYSLIGRSEPMQKLMEMIRKVSETDANILVTGENGTGKELIAREIHRLSNRNKEIFVSVDMGAISESLFESELFGHVKGSFTDAANDRTGKFELANKGTLFLDEIGNLSQGLQAKMLAALQNRTVIRLGSNTEIPIDIRLISATNKNLEEMIERNEFRQDLLYRINTISIELPPLRERGNDILLLSEFYLKKYSSKYDKRGLKINSRAARKLLKYDWPGNVRELQHSIEKAVILADDNTLDENSFSLSENFPARGQNFKNQTLEEMEKDLILKNIKKEKGNMSAVSKNLGISRQTLYNKLKRYEI